jgi:GNAT superfamily N-acetyltransferase
VKIVRRWLAAIVKLPHTPGLLLVQKLLRQIPFRPVDLGKLCFLELNGVPRVPQAMLRGATTVRSATVEDIPELVRLQDKPELFRERFAGGDECVVALSEGRIVGYEWFCASPEHRESTWNLPIAIPGGFVYAYDAYIDPTYRNTGVWLRFKAFLGERMAATGKQGVLTFVDYGNWPSLRTHIRFGFIPSESVLALKVLGLYFYRKLRAIGTTTWLYVMYVLMHKGPAIARVVHVGHFKLRLLHQVPVRSLAHALVASVFTWP